MTGFASFPAFHSGVFSFLCIFLSLLCVSRVPFLETAAGRDRLVPAHRVFALAACVLAGVHAFTALPAAGTVSPAVVSSGYAAFSLLFLLSVPDVFAYLAGKSRQESDAKAGLLVRKRFPGYQARELIRLAQALVPFAVFVHVFTFDMGKFAISRAEITLFPPLHDVAAVFLPTVLSGFLSVLSFALWLTGNHSWRLGSGVRTLKVLSVIRETGLATTIRFERPEGYDFKPGQFVSVRFVASAVPDEEHPFVLSSSPSERKFLSVTVKSRGIFTNCISSVKPGDRLIVSPPAGSFFWKEYPDRKLHVFMAGGIGITPFLSMLNFLADRDGSMSILLLYCARTRDDLVAQDDFHSFLRTVPGLTVVPVLSNDPLWTGAKGFPSRELIAREFNAKFGSGSAFRDAEWWVSGPEGFLGSVRKILHEIGIPLRIRHFFGFKL